MSAEIDRLAGLVAAADRFGAWARNGLRDALIADGYAKEDAECLDALMAAAPSLLAVARAAEYRDGCAELCVSMTPYRGCTCGHVELEAALAALGTGS